MGSLGYIVVVNIASPWFIIRISPFYFHQDLWTQKPISKADTTSNSNQKITSSEQYWFTDKQFTIQKQNDNNIPAVISQLFLFFQSRRQYSLTRVYILFFSLGGSSALMTVVQDILTYHCSCICVSQNRRVFLVVGRRWSGRRLFFFVLIITLIFIPLRSLSFIIIFPQSPTLTYM